LVRSPNLAAPFSPATRLPPRTTLFPSRRSSDLVTLPVKLGTTFPAPSSALTCTAGLIAAPATVVDGCTVNTSWVAVPGVMSKARPEERTSELQSRGQVVCRLVLLIHRSKNVATP